MHIPAAAWNAMLDLLERSASHAYGPADGPRRGQFADQIVLVRNDSEAARDRCCILEVSDSVWDPGSGSGKAGPEYFKGHVALVGVVPTATCAGRFVVLIEPLPADAIGRAWGSGVCPVQIDVVDAAHLYAGSTTGNTDKLTSAATGPALILWKQAGIGTKWAVVRLGGSSARTPFLVKLTEVVSQGVYSGVEQQHGTGGWEDVPGADPIGCQNVFEFDTASSPLLVDEEHQPMVLVAVVDDLYLFDRPTNALYRQEETP